MKALRLIALVAVCVACGHASAQDLIVKTDGTVIQAKVTKVGTSEVEYKKWSNQDGPQYSIVVNDILAINYENGEKEMFENRNSKPTNSESEGQQSIINLKTEDLSQEVKVANDELIAKINAPVALIVREKDKKDVGVKEANSAVACFGVSAESILCNEDIEISVETGELYKSSSKSPAEWKKGGLTSWHRNIGHWTDGVVNPAIQFVIKNKSSQTLYIDLANTFYVNMGQSQTFYIPSSTTTSKTSSGGGSVNLGAVTGALGIGGAAGTLANGVNVGGGSSSTTTNTTYSQRIIALAPMSSVSLSPLYFFGNEEKDITTGLHYGLYGRGMYSYLYCPYINFPTKSQDGAMMFGDHYVYNEANSPVQFSFYLCYSKVESGNGAKILPTTFYLRDLIGQVGGYGEPTNKAMPCYGFFVNGFFYRNNGGYFPKP